MLSLIMSKMRFPALVALLALAACAHPRIGTGGVPTTGGGEAPKQAVNDACVLATGSVSTNRPTITVGLTEVVDPHDAPLPRNDAERLVFRHLYETPVRLDRQGHATPPLAAERSEERRVGEEWRSRWPP